MTKNKYKEIERKAELLMEKTHDPMHDFSHIQRVTENSLKIVDLLNLGKKINLDILKIACLFHDIAFTRHKPSLSTWLFEGKLSTKILRELDIFSPLKKSEFSIIEKAIRYHGLAFPFRRLNKKRDLYCQILQDADMLDQFHLKRIKSLKKSKEKGGFFYYVMFVFHKPVAKFANKNIHFFLNFPQLAKTFVAKNYSKS